MQCTCTYTDEQIASGMRRLSGKIATPPGFDRDLVRELQGRRLMKFNEWPSGHWSITESGYNFLASVDSE